MDLARNYAKMGDSQSAPLILQVREDENEMNEMTTTVVSLAFDILPGVRKQLAADEEDYQEQCEYDRSQGHAPHHCRHGVNLWFDYDIPCGACEGGYDLTPAEYALSLARIAIRESEEASKSLQDAIQFLFKNQHAAKAIELLEMIWEPIASLRKYYSSD